MTVARSTPPAFAAALGVYENALRDGRRLWSRPAAGGPAHPLDTARYLGCADAADLQVLAHCHGRVLDVGCGPGRMVAACRAAGHETLGIDVAHEAVRRTRARSGRAAHVDVFGPVPGAGEWDTALLLDGNIGIGADPHRLLSRVCELLAPDGRIVVETDPDHDTDRRGELVFVDADGSQRSSPFAWARLGRRGLHEVAARVGLRPDASWARDGREFSLLRLSRSDA